MENERTFPWKYTRRRYNGSSSSLNDLSKLNTARFVQQITHFPLVVACATTATTKRVYRRLVSLLKGTFHVLNDKENDFAFSYCYCLENARWKFQTEIRRIDEVTRVYRRRWYWKLWNHFSRNHTSPTSKLVSQKLTKLPTWNFNNS